MGVKKMNRPQREYYVLAPLYDKNSTIYIPVDTEQNPLRPVMTRQQALNLIDQLPELTELHFDSMNDEKLRAADILSSGDQLRLAQLTKTMYHIQRRRARSSKNAYATDRGILRQAERLLFGELAVSLELTVDGVQDFISRQLEADVAEA
ncbi:MAG: CarD family transcriptional regulator [Oscillospiraceae bacterium]|nr:CarD family transcriptional regulator [Oscillospiraceae bacterium]